MKNFWNAVIDEPMIMYFIFMMTIIIAMIGFDIFDKNQKRSIIEACLSAGNTPEKCQELSLDKKIP